VYYRETLDGPWRDNASAYDMAVGMKSEDRKQQRCDFAEERTQGTHMGIQNQMGIWTFKPSMCPIQLIRGQKFPELLVSI